MREHGLWSGAAMLVAAMLATMPGAASAGLVLSQAVVDIEAAGPAARDIELWNDGTETSYVVVEPSEIVDAGLPGERRQRIVDPGAGGLLVSPQRLILRGGERKLVRIAAVAERPARDRIYRVTVKPVVGPTQADQTALKLLVGYDVLVIYRPQAPVATLIGERAGGQLTIRNTGTTNVELYEGKQCPAGGGACRTLPATRLYAGQTFRQPIASPDPVEYRVATGQHSTVQRF